MLLCPAMCLQVDILDLQPRPNPGKNNESWGFTGNYGIGWWAKYAPCPCMRTSTQPSAARLFLACVVPPLKLAGSTICRQLNHSLPHRMHAPTQVQAPCMCTASTHAYRQALTCNDVSCRTGLATPGLNASNEAQAVVFKVGPPACFASATCLMHLCAALTACAPVHAQQGRASTASACSECHPAHLSADCLNPKP